ncbi:glycosyltransferase [uncultured Sphingomonas sp.]|uniref:glycosyltransferase n=1 Tax=uncultured Sphingomonas sp. TaxID=158754 RepID=UPI0035CAD3C2
MSEDVVEQDRPDRERRATIAFTLHELGQGGTDRVCAHLARGFAEAGFAVELIVLFGGAPTTATMLSLIGDGVTVRALNERRGSRHLDRLIVLPRLVARLRASAPDVVMSTGNNMNWTTALAFRLARLGSARLMLKVTNPIVRAKDGPLRRWYRRLRYADAFGLSDAVLTLCDREAELLAAAFPASASRFQPVVNPYVTPAMLAPCRELVGERDMILAIGRLAPQKRFDLLIRAFAEVRAPGARLVILGEGPDRASLETLARELGLDGRVTMPGYVADVGPWLRRVRLLALSSRYEGLPAVVLEAMASGCPVVATDCFLAARTLVGGAEGCAVVGEATPAAFARALEKCWSRERPTMLPAVAERYSVGEGVRSHVAAVRRLLDPVPGENARQVALAVSARPAGRP